MSQGVMTSYDNVMDGIVEYNKKNLEGQRSMDDDSIRSIHFPVTLAEVKVPHTVNYGESLELDVVIESDESLPVQLSFVAINVSQQPVMCWHSSRSTQNVCIQPGRQVFRIKIDHVLLHDGTYKYTFNASRLGGIEHVVWYARVGEFNVVSDYRPVGDIPYLPMASRWEQIFG